ncbi:MAG: NAD(+)/NADH kinase [Acidobacteriaceae bacterium]|nr:NAD(+)/NADH kinase [Acidobacteriaceae bacterium]
MGFIERKRAAIIYNPVARSLSRRLHLLQRTIEVLGDQGISAKLVATEAAGTAGEQTRFEIDSGCDMILAAGGDGTINEVASGMLHTGVPLGIIPGGTANVLAREMHIPQHMVRAIVDLRWFEPQPVAIGDLRFADGAQRPFLCMAGAGLDAQIVSRLNLRFKALAGKFAYYGTGFAQVFQPLREFEVVVDGKPYLASFALVSRVRNYGGDLEIARTASLLRDEFEVVLFRGTSGFRYLGYLAGVASGNVARINGCTVLRARSVSCPQPEASNIFVQIDGELAGSLPIRAEILPDAITLLMPQKFVARERSMLAFPVCA